MERITKVRAIALLLIFSMVLSFFGVRLFKSQVVEADENSNNSSTYTTMTRVLAARGDVLDRNGNVLISNRASYDLVFINYVILSADGTNDYLLTLINQCRKMKFEHNDHFPVTKVRPYEYTLDQAGSDTRSHFTAYLAKMELDSDITAPLLMKTLRRVYHIPEGWSDEDAREVIGLRYELALRSGITNLGNYVFISDATDRELAAIQELNIPGLKIEPTTVREYHTKYGAHIMGYVGAMDPEQWEEYRKTGEYLMDAEVGQAGFEAAFEKELHGVDGWRIDTYTKDGTVVKSYYESEPRAGNNVETTIDLRLQMVAEDSLDKVMHMLRDQEPGKDGSDAEGAAAVAMDVRTGEILACASYPTYDPARFFTDYEELSKAEFSPLYNRALLQTYPPGSTYKMVTAIAGLNTHTITKFTEIETLGIYRKYDDGNFSPTCHIYTNGFGATHGIINVMQALMVSCNYFFYVLGDMLSINELDPVSKSLGLGEPTGVELYENIGVRGNEETKWDLYHGADALWYPADQLQTVIGQGMNLFTPLQLCSYTATLANRGDRYRATFLRRVISDNYSQLLRENSPEILNKAYISDEAYEAYSEGMKLVASNYEGTAFATFGNYEVPVAAKTGTAQHGDDNKSDHGAMVAYAPADKPEIAVVVYGEQAGHGSTLGIVARDILDAYFNSDIASDVSTYENQVS